MRATRLFPFFTALMLVTPGISSADDIVVYPTDKVGFQLEIDNANPGDTLVCVGGDYDFSALGAVMITKSLKIEAEDADDPPVFHGLVDGMGNFVFIGGPAIYSGNMGFAVAGGSEIDGLEFEGLAFEGFHRCIFIAAGWVQTPMGCASTSDGFVKKLKMEGNHISNCFYGIFLLGGPLEKFKIKDNVIDCRTGAIALNVQADYIPCGPVFVNTARSTKGEIKGNTLYGGPSSTMSSFRFPAMNVAGAEDVQVKNNTVWADPTSDGILVRDDKAYTFGPFMPSVPAFGDDGPIKTGQIKDNTIHNAHYGIVCRAATTLQNVQIKDNTMVNTGLRDISLISSPAPPGTNGANGFTVKDNTFSTTATEANVFLEATTFNNVIKVSAGAVVVDMAPPGNNEVQVE